MQRLKWLEHCLHWPFSSWSHRAPGPEGNLWAWSAGWLSPPFSPSHESTQPAGGAKWTSLLPWISPQVLHFTHRGWQRDREQGGVCCGVKHVFILIFTAGTKWQNSGGETRTANNRFNPSPALHCVCFVPKLKLDHISLLSLCVRFMRDVCVCSSTWMFSSWYSRSVLSVFSRSVWSRASCSPWVRRKMWVFCASICCCSFSCCEGKPDVPSVDTSSAPYFIQHF